MLLISPLSIGYALSGYIIPKKSENVSQAKYKPTNQDTKKPSGTFPTVDEACNVKSGYQKQSKKENDR